MIGKLHAFDSNMRDNISNSKLNDFAQNLYKYQHNQITYVSHTFVFL